MEEGVVVERSGQKIGVLLKESRDVLRAIPLGKIRKTTKIYAGDNVKGFVDETGVFVIEEVEERRNLLKRPPVANVDRVVVVACVGNPPFNHFFYDGLLAVYDYLGFDVIVVFNKIDELSSESLKKFYQLRDIYQNAGYEVFGVSAETKEGVDELKGYLDGFISVFAGPSGVGKSSIVSSLTGESLKTGGVSRKTRRGRHTTTAVKLIEFDRGFIADTPGFSHVDINAFIPSDKIRLHFREFLRYQCRFSDCKHINESGCGVKEALKNGKISCLRYKSYLKAMGAFVDWLNEVC
ncbi:ribosome small subunit-dependent GTPase A [Hippea jasoniae]|uniref:ribosome small subunit-dependent GTPase A n=1 Tax=Hippea jasoniae TaxID=944479 RepID=UPI00054E0DE0|nr:ribosome small subunit-dependent GTPase A [Hippea jasoniae]